MTTAAASFDEMLEYVNPNILEIADPTAAPTPLKALLKTWRLEFFSIWDLDAPEEAKVHSWIIPTLALESHLEDGVVKWFEIGEIIALVSNTISAAAFNGFVPSAGQEAAMLVAFNNAWT